MNNQNSKSTGSITTKTKIPTMDDENKQQIQAIENNLKNINETTIDNLSTPLDEKVNEKK